MNAGLVSKIVRNIESTNNGWLFCFPSPSVEDINFPILTLHKALSGTYGARSHHIFVYNATLSQLSPLIMYLTDNCPFPISLI